MAPKIVSAHPEKRFSNAQTHFGVFQKKKLFDVRSAGFGDFFRFFQFPHHPPFKKPISPKTEKVVRRPAETVKIKKVDI